MSLIWNVFIHPEVFVRKSLLPIVTEFLLFLDITGNLTCLQIKGKDFIKMCQTTDTIAVNNLTLSFVNFTLKKVNKTLWKSCSSWNMVQTVKENGVEITVKENHDKPMTCATFYNPVIRGCEQTQLEVSAFWWGKENFVHKRFFIKYRQINIFKVKNTILYENCTLWALTAYEKYCCHPLKIEKFVPNGKPLKYQHSRVGKCH